MNTGKFIIIWHFFAFTYVCFFIVFFAIFPEIEAFTWLSNKYGFIDIEMWDIYFVVAASVVTAVVNAIFIYFVFKIHRKLKL